MKKIYNL